MNFGEKIKELRIKNKLTQQDIADKFFVTRQAVSRWEQGKSIPSIDVVELIAKEFNVSIDYLISEDNNIETKEEIIENRPLNVISTNSKKYDSAMNKIFLTIITMLVMLFIVTFIYIIIDSKRDENNFIYISPVMLNDEEIINDRQNWNQLGNEYYLSANSKSYYVYLCKEINERVEVEFVEQIFSTNDSFDENSLITKARVINGIETKFNYYKVPKMIEILSFNIYGDLIKDEIYKITDFNDTNIYYVYDAISYTIKAYYDSNNTFLFNYHLDSTNYSCKSSIYLPRDYIGSITCLEFQFAVSSI